MIRDQIKAELVKSMKEKNEARTATIRLINASIKDKDIEARPKGILNGIDDTAILSLLQNMIKQRRESIEMYKQGNRMDLVEKEQAEVDIISEFLPEQMSAEEMESKIRDVIAETGATSIKDMGKVMGALKAKYAGVMDFAVASGIIKKVLNG